MIDNKKSLEERCKFISVTQNSLPDEELLDYYKKLEERKFSDFDFEISKKDFVALLVRLGNLYHSKPNLKNLGPAYRVEYDFACEFREVILKGNLTNDLYKAGLEYFSIK